MNLQKGIKNLVISIFIFFLVGGTYAVWTGLIAEEGDILDVSKWNELVNKVLVLETDSTDLNTSITSLENTTTDLNNDITTNDSRISTLEDESSSVLQTHIFSDYTRRTTADGGYYYFGGSEFSNSITPKKTDSIIQIDINYFGEVNSHNVHTILQYSINGGAWSNFDLTGSGQQGTLKVGSYPDTDYNSTPHNYSTQVAKKFNTTGTISFRMYHFNSGTFRHNGSVNASYESGPSTLIIKELNADNSSYSKR